ncbi:thioredoxin family protein [Candidatus Woesearchaeota archaeon]|nr:thioredoxin family protein [Candidatus Woesearchaeota archaeon]
MKRKTILPALIVIIALIVIVVLVNKSDEKVVPEIVDETEVIVYEFYGASCPHCKNLNNWFEEIKPKYPNLKVIQYEVYSNQSNRELFQQVSEAYGTKAGGVPAVFIGEEKFIGFGPDTGDKIEQKIQNCINAICASPAEELLR